MVILPNGFDLQYFSPPRPHTKAHKNADIVEITAIGRNHPSKGCSNFFSAAKLVCDGCALTHYSINGRGCANEVVLQRQIEDFQLERNFERHDELADVLVEAMAMGVPCTATNAGDAALIVGNAGEIVPIGDPKALAEAIAKLTKLNSEKRHEFGHQSKQTHC